MKKRTLLRVGSLLLVLVLLSGLFAACKNSGTLRIINTKKGTSDYVIVYASGSVAYQNIAADLQSRIQAGWDVELPVKSDRDPKEEGTPEILLGPTNRAASAKLTRSLRSGDYLVAVDGEDVLILGGNEKLLQQAVRQFCSDVLTDEATLEGTGVVYQYAANTYKISEVKLNDRPITDYTLFYPSGSGLPIDWKTIAEYFNERLGALSGYQVPTESYKGTPGASDGPRIILSSSTEGLGETEFKVDITGGDITIQAGSFSAGLALLERALANWVPEDARGTVAFSLDATNGKQSLTNLPSAGKDDDVDVRFLSFNIWLHYGPTEWQLPVRANYINAIAYAYMPDFLCFQEYAGKTGNADNLIGSKLLAAGYGRVGTGNIESYGPKTKAQVQDPESDGNVTRYGYLGDPAETQIFYRPEKWELLESDCFLYYYMDRVHENPKGATWGVFQQRETGRKVLVISMHGALFFGNYSPEHADYKGQDDNKWRLENIKEVLMVFDEMREKYPGISAAIMGDMNAVEASDALTWIEDRPEFTNVKRIASSRSEGASGHANIGEMPVGQNAIDHVYVTDDTFTARRHWLLTTQTALHGSDHCPVIADVLFKK